MKLLAVLSVIMVVLLAACGSSNAPHNNSPPTFSSSRVKSHNLFASSSVAPTVGDILDASHGAWSNSPATYAFQWQYCEASGSPCNPISGATQASYTVVTHDLNYKIQVQVTACNQQGCSSQTSTQTAVVLNTPVSSFCNISAAYNNLTTGPHICGFPDSTNTGYQNAPGFTSLTTASSGSSTCPTTPLSNHTYSFCKYVGGLALPGGLVNTTFFGDSFYDTNPQNANVHASGSGVNNITFDYDTFQPAQSAPPVSCDQSYQYGIYDENGFIQGYTVSHSDFWGFGNAIDTDNSTQANPQIFTYNWIHDTVSDALTTDTCGYHTDGIGAESGSAVTMSYAVTDHNTIQFPGNTNLIAWQNGSYSHMQNTNNLLSGDNESYAVARCSSSCTPATYIQTTGNTFSTFFPIVGGPIDATGHPWNNTGSTWDHNYWAVPSGANWGTPAYNGHFWIPTGDSNYPEDCGFVSTTDWPSTSLCG